MVHQFKSAVLHGRDNKSQQNRHHKHQRQADFVSQQDAKIFCYGSDEFLHCHE